MRGVQPERGGAVGGAEASGAWAAGSSPGRGVAPKRPGGGSWIHCGLGPQRQLTLRGDI